MTRALPPHPASGCCSDFTLDRFRAGEMNAEESTAQRAHLAASATCAARLAVLEAARVEFAALPALHFPAALAAGNVIALPPLSVVAPLRRRRSMVFASASAFALAAAAAVVISVPDAETRIKGEGPPATVALFVRRDDRVLPAAQAAPLRAGDVLRGRVSAQRSVYVGVVEVEADGDVARHLPASGGLQRVGDGDTDLDGASKLDEQRGPIDLVALMCDDDVVVDDIVLAGVSRGVAPAGCALEHHRFEKTALEQAAP